VATTEKPTLAALRGELLWKLDRAGTCSPNHFKKMGLEKIGVVPIDWNKLVRIPEALRPGTSAAISDISIANSFRHTPAAWIKQEKTIQRLDDVLTESA